MNRVCLVGRLTKDPEGAYTPNGTAVTKFTIAVNRFTKDEEGNYEADFFPVVCWRKTAEFASQYLVKGQLVSLEGRLQTRQWTDAQGVRKYMTEIIADNVQGLSKPKDEEGKPEKPAGKKQASVEDNIDDGDFNPYAV